MKNSTIYKIIKISYPKVSICGIGCSLIGEYLGIGIGGNFSIGEALIIARVMQ